MVGMAEVEVDRETGAVEMIDYVAVVDCGTPINPNLARVQTEGGTPRVSVWLSLRTSNTVNGDRC